MNKIVTLLLLLLPFLNFGQSLAEQETVLAGLLNEIRSTKNNQQREKANIVFKDALKKAIESSGSFQHPFQHAKLKIYDFHLPYARSNRKSALLLAQK